MAAPGFWDNQDHAREVIDESNQLKGWIEPYRGLESKAADLAELAELLEVEADADLEAEWVAEIDLLPAGIEALELQTMLQGPDDHRGAILTVHPGAGGLESQDWAEMVLRMYTRWAERRGFKLSVLDLQPADEAGIKSATVEVDGDRKTNREKARIRS